MRSCLAQAGIVMDCRDLSVHVFLLSQLCPPQECPEIKTDVPSNLEKERIEAERASFSLKPLLLEWLASLTCHKCIMKKKADPGGCPWGPPFPQHTISRFGESTRQLEDGYDWGMALDFGLRKLHIFWPYCAEEKGTVCSMAWNSASLPCFCSGFCRAFWDVSHHFIPVICWGKKVRKSICVFFQKKQSSRWCVINLSFTSIFFPRFYEWSKNAPNFWIAKRFLQKCVSPVGLQHSHPADMFSQTGWES